MEDVAKPANNDCYAEQDNDGWNDEAAPDGKHFIGKFLPGFQSQYRRDDHRPYRCAQPCTADAIDKTVRED